MWLSTCIVIRKNKNLKKDETLTGTGVYALLISVYGMIFELF